MRRTREDALKTREAILQAAAHTISELGVGGFTIDAVAQETGITKGGVLHHFASKEALVDALIDEVLASFQLRLAEQLAAEPTGVPGRWLRAYIRAVFPNGNQESNLLPALAAAVSSDKETIDCIRQSMEMSQSQALEDGFDPVTASIVRLAVDGAIFTTAFKVFPLDRQMSATVREALLRAATPVEPSLVDSGNRAG